MNIVIPMSGGSENFRESRYTKNFTEIGDKPLFQVVAESLSNAFRGEQFIFIVPKDEVTRYHIDKALTLLIPGSIVIVREGETAGAACSVLLAAEYLDNEEELLIHNGDSVITENLNRIVHSFRTKSLDGGTVTFESVHPRWSYVRMNDDCLVIEAAEKNPISMNATAGVYYFRQGHDFVQSAERMIEKDANTDGKYYVCPTYNEMILQGKRIGFHQISRQAYFPLTTPKEMERFETYMGGRHEKCKTE